MAAGGRGRLLPLGERMLPPSSKGNRPPADHMVGRPSSPLGRDGQSTAGTEILLGICRSGRVVGIEVCG